MKTKSFLSCLMAFLLCLVLSGGTAISAETPTGKPPYKIGKLLPSGKQTLEALTAKIIREANAASSSTTLLPVIQEFKDMIEDDPELYMLFTEMFEQVPNKAPYTTDPSGMPQIRDYNHMLWVLNHIMTKAPEFNKTGMVGFPINAILNWPMGTPAGSKLFLNEKVNRQLKKILNYWAIFLASPDSCYVLSDDPKRGWFGLDAKAAMPTFEKDFICDPGAPHYGFTSWDDFFTRRFREESRPVASPDDDAVIANACESAPYKLAKNIQLRDKFWIKGQPYSLTHMFGGDPMAELFVGGTIYQAFLSALSYHRWHSPVSGTVVKTKNFDGSYYAGALSEGFDAANPNASQSYLTSVAARALICIDADNPDIGLMCSLFVGMAEVSSNEITVYEGQHVKKGDQVGMFHFGGSTHTLIFRPEVDLEFDLHGQTPGLESSNILVRQKLATVKNSEKK